MPWLGPVWTNNPLQQYLRGSGKSPGIAFAQARIQERKDVEREKGKDDADVNDRDFLSRFMELEAEDPTIPPEQVEKKKSNSTWCMGKLTFTQSSSCLDFLKHHRRQRHHRHPPTDHFLQPPPAPPNP